MNACSQFSLLASKQWHVLICKKDCWTSGDATSNHLLREHLDDRLDLDITGEGFAMRHILSLAPFRRIVRDYLEICRSYNDAVRNATPAHIETVDMGRRGLHNEGSELLRERLAGKIEVDLDTARRLFTLICALHITS